MTAQDKARLDWIINVCTRLMNDEPVSTADLELTAAIVAVLMPECESTFQDLIARRKAVH
jgi:hypothetical protein